MASPQACRISQWEWNLQNAYAFIGITASTRSGAVGRRRAKDELSPVGHDDFDINNDVASLGRSGRK